MLMHAHENNSQPLCSQLKQLSWVAATPECAPYVSWVISAELKVKMDASFFFFKSPIVSPMDSFVSPMDSFISLQKVEKFVFL